MFILLSPSKTLNFDDTQSQKQATTPLFVEQTALLADVLASKTADDLSTMMKLSDKLAQLNYTRYQSFGSQTKAPAFFAFEGDTYKDIQKDSYDAEDLAYAQAHLRILSGLYGALRPLDTIEPYRLEMGTKIKTQTSKTLYEYWKTQLTAHCQQSIKDSMSAYVINLASVEYAKVIDFKALDVPTITPVFKDEKNGNFKVIAFYAKRARGMMADYLLRHRVTTLDDLCAFSGGGYLYEPMESEPLAPVFKRKATH